MNIPGWALEILRKIWAYIKEKWPKVVDSLGKNVTLGKAIVGSFCVGSLLLVVFFAFAVLYLYKTDTTNSTGYGLELSLPFYKEYIRTIDPKLAWQDVGIEIDEGSKVKVSCSGEVCPSVEPLEKYFTKLAAYYVESFVSQGVESFGFEVRNDQGRKRIELKLKPNAGTEQEFWTWLMLYSLFYDGEYRRATLATASLRETLKNNREYDGVKKSGAYKEIYALVEKVCENEQLRSEFQDTLDSHFEKLVSIKIIDKIQNATQVKTQTLLKWLEEAYAIKRQIAFNAWPYTKSRGYTAVDYAKLFNQKQTRELNEYGDKSFSVRKLPHNVLVMASSGDRPDVDVLNRVPIVFASNSYPEDKDYNTETPVKKVVVDGLVSGVDFNERYKFALINGDGVFVYRSKRKENLAFCVNDSNDYRADNGGYYTVRVKVLYLPAPVRWVRSLFSASGKG